MEEITCNMNDFVFVRLNERGLKILENDFLRRREAMTDINPFLAVTFGDFTPPKQDEEGWTKFQLWELMEKFGSYMCLGCHQPFETIKIKIKQA